MNALTPSDDVDNETDWHRDMIVKSLNAKKAPEHDLIEVKMVKEAWPVIQLPVLGLFNSCLTKMVFPTQYKRAQIKVLLKGEGEDRTDPKS